MNSNAKVNDKKGMDEAGIRITHLKNTIAQLLPKLKKLEKTCSSLKPKESIFPNQPENVSKPESVSSLPIFIENKEKNLNEIGVKAQLDTNCKFVPVRKHSTNSVDTNSTSSKSVQENSRKEEKPTADKTKRKRGKRNKENVEQKKNENNQLKRLNRKERYSEKQDASYELIRNHENLLLIRLLCMNSERREDFLIDLAKKNNLLQKNRQTKQLDVDPAFKSVLPIVFAGMDWSSNLDNVLKKVNSKPNDQDKERSSLEDQINKLLHDDVPDVDENLLLVFDRNADQTVNDEILEQFVDRLVEANLGYVAEGPIRINANNKSGAFMPNSNGGRDVYFSSVLLRKCAMDGDIVRAFVKNKVIKVNSETPEEEKIAPTSILAAVEESESDEKVIGFVFKIVEKRHNRKFVGTFNQYRTNSGSYSIIPRDKRIPLVKIKAEDMQNLLKNKIKIANFIFLAELIDWKDEKPYGRIIKQVGLVGELSSENRAILIQNGLDPEPYSEEIIKMLPPLPFVIPEEEIERRSDLRKDCIFTIDPLTARDLDDAVSCRQLPNGNFEIGVHISDVSYFVQENSILDEIVKEKTTSIYMVDAVYHMLPKELCMLCSLLPGEDKLAFSVFWEITPDAKILQTNFAKTVINSCTQLAYEHAQEIIENPGKKFDWSELPHIYNKYGPTDISRVINQLHRIAVQLRQKRIESGALRIDQPKIGFELDPLAGTPVKYYSQKLKESNRLIEEFMLLANMSVADHTHSKFPEISVLRSHFPPKKDLMVKLARTLDNHGMKLDATSSRTISESLSQMVASSENPEAANVILSALLSRPMNRARYFCGGSTKEKDDFSHYALAVDLYTHFTSPIRRYPDVMVHRILSTALTITPSPTRTAEEIQAITNVCNIQKYNAKLAGNESIDLYFIHYVKFVGSVEMRAAVFDISSFRMEIILIETGHRLKMNYKEMPDVDVKVDEAEGRFSALATFLRPEKSSIKLQLFSECLVSVSVDQKDRLKAILIPITK